MPLWSETEATNSCVFFHFIRTWTPLVLSKTERWPKTSPSGTKSRWIENEIIFGQLKSNWFPKGKRSTPDRIDAWQRTFSSTVALSLIWIECESGRKGENDLFLPGLCFVWPTKESARERHLSTLMLVLCLAFVFIEGESNRSLWNKVSQLDEEEETEFYTSREKEH